MDAVLPPLRCPLLSPPLFTPSLRDTSRSSPRSLLPSLSPASLCLLGLGLGPEPAAMEGLNQAVPPCLRHTPANTLALRGIGTLIFGCGEEIPQEATDSHRPTRDQFLGSLFLLGSSARSAISPFFVSVCWISMQKQTRSELLTHQTHAHTPHTSYVHTPTCSHRSARPTCTHTDVSPCRQTDARGADERTPSGVCWRSCDRTLHSL